MTEDVFVEMYIEEIMRRGIGFDREIAKEWAKCAYENDPDKTDIPYVVSEDIQAVID